MTSVPIVLLNALTGEEYARLHRELPCVLCVDTIRKETGFNATPFLVADGLASADNAPEEVRQLLLSPFDFANLVHGRMVPRATSDSAVYLPLLMRSTRPCSGCGEARLLHVPAQIQHYTIGRLVGICERCGGSRVVYPWACLNKVYCERCADVLCWPHLRGVALTASDLDTTCYAYKMLCAACVHDEAHCPS